MASEDNKIGLVPATLMVAGNMMGSGVFMLPANLAAIGGFAVVVDQLLKEKEPGKGR